MEVPRHWRLKKQRYSLQGFEYSKCGHKELAGAPVCRQCLALQNQEQLIINQKLKVQITREVEQEVTA